MPCGGPDGGEPGEGGPGGPPSMGPGPGGPGGEACGPRDPDAMPGEKGTFPTPCPGVGARGAMAPRI